MNNWCLMINFEIIMMNYELWTINDASSIMNCEFTIHNLQFWIMNDEYWVMKDEVLSFISQIKIHEFVIEYCKRYFVNHDNNQCMINCDELLIFINSHQIIDLIKNTTANSTWFEMIIVSNSYLNIRSNPFGNPVSNFQSLIFMSQYHSRVSIHKLILN
jgi:hypothetical protein